MKGYAITINIPRPMKVVHCATSALRQLVGKMSRCYALSYNRVTLFAFVCLPSTQLYGVFQPIESVTVREYN